MKNFEKGVSSERNNHKTSKSKPVMKEWRKNHYKDKEGMQDAHSCYRMLYTIIKWQRLPAITKR